MSALQCVSGPHGPPKGSESVLGTQAIECQREHRASVSVKAPALGRASHRTVSQAPRPGFSDVDVQSRPWPGLGIQGERQNRVWDSALPLRPALHCGTEEGMPRGQCRAAAEEQSFGPKADRPGDSRFLEPCVKNSEPRSGLSEQCYPPRWLFVPEFTTPRMPHVAMLTHPALALPGKILLTLPS